MKNLANCGPREFMKQTAEIRHAVAKWLTITDIANIRKRIPDIPKDANEEQKKELIEKQARENVGLILDSILDMHPEETVDLLALCCFVDPKNADDYPMSEYLGAFADMVNDDNVLRFFTSFLKLARRSGLLD